MRNEGGGFAAVYMGRCPKVVFKSSVTSDPEASDSRIVISSEARNLCHSRSGGQCLENSKRETCY